MRRSLLILFFMLGISTGAGYAQTGISLFAGAGTSIPVSDTLFTQSFGPGYSIEVGVGIQAPLGTVRLDIAYNKFSAKENTDSKATITSLKVNYVFGNINLLPVAPYGVVGAGLYFLGADPILLNTGPSGSVAQEFSESNLGFAIGGGVTIKTGTRSSLFAEVQYNYNITDSYAKSFIPIKAGFIFSL